MNGRDFALGALAGLAVAGTFARRGSRDEIPAEAAWWHGTSVENAQAILADRLRGRTERGRSSLAPLPGRVYVTRDFGLALTHAFGGLLEFGKLDDPSLAAGVGFHHYHKPTGAILVVRVGACVPDEDWLGELLLDIAQGQSGTARRSLSIEGNYRLARVYWLVSDEARTRWKRSRFPWDLATWARAGKVACNQLLKTQAGRDALAALFPHSPHAACLDTDVQVLGAWSLTQEAAKRLRPDGSNIAEVGVRLDLPAKQATVAGALGGSFYHVTTFNRMVSVAKRGLVVGAGSIEDSTFRHFSSRSHGKLFLAAGLDAGIAWWTLIRQQYDPEPVLLEVDPSIRRGRSIFHDNKGWNDVECSFYTKKGVAPRFLRYWDPEEGEFMPLSAWAEILKRPEDRIGRFCPYTEDELAEGDEDYEDDEIHFDGDGS